MTPSQLCNKFYCDWVITFLAKKKLHFMWYWHWVHFGKVESWKNQKKTLRKEAVSAYHYPILHFDICILIHIKFSIKFTIWNFFIYCKKFAIHSIKSEFSCEVKRKDIFRVLLSGNKKFVQSQSQWLPYSLWQKYIRYNHFNWIEIQSMLQKKMKLCFHSFKMERETKMTGGWIS